MYNYTVGVAFFSSHQFTGYSNMLARLVTDNYYKKK
jgi:hypothetical protein